MSMSETDRRLAVVAAALTWVRTPFAWQQCVKGPQGGVDCGRFIAASFNETGAVAPINIASFPQFASDWFMHKRDDQPSPFIDQIRRFATEYVVPASKAVPEPADMVVAKLGRDWAHSALVIRWPRVIACANGFCVTEWQDIRRSPQYGSRPLRYFDLFRGRTIDTNV